jgi:hypothetical protein
MATSTLPPSCSFPSPSSNGVSCYSVWVQRLSWLISALSGTLEIEAETERLKIQNEKTRNETKQIEKENERLAELESKINLSFSKYGINLSLAQKPKQP